MEEQPEIFAVLSQKILPYMALTIWDVITSTEMVLQRTEARATWQYKNPKPYRTSYGQLYKNSYFIQDKSQVDTLQEQEEDPIGDVVLMESGKVELPKYGLTARSIVLSEW